MPRKKRTQTGEQQPSERAARQTRATLTAVALALADEESLNALPLESSAGKEGKRTIERFPLPLTAGQREALIHATRLKAAVKRKIGGASKGTQVVLFTAKELDHMDQETGVATMFAPPPYKRCLVAVYKKL